MADMPTPTTQTASARSKKNSKLNGNGHINNQQLKSGIKVIAGDSLPQAGWDQSKMKKKMKFIKRKLMPGLGEAVAKRTILRGDETWADVAARVAEGNVGLLKKFGTKMKAHQKQERELLEKHIATATMLMSGRHLQHGDKTQVDRNMEVFTNCSTASASYILFYLLLNGSGVGRAYDDDMCLVNWDNMPIVRCVLDESHGDFVWGVDESVRDARHKYDKVFWFEVPDSREGWAQAIEKLEVMAYEKKYKDDVLVLDFSKVRAKGSPIGGMQNRPASGPKPLMNAIMKVATVKNAGMSPWCWCGSMLES